MESGGRNGDDVCLSEFADKFGDVKIRTNGEDGGLRFEAESGECQDEVVKLRSGGSACAVYTRLPLTPRSRHASLSNLIHSPALQDGSLRQISPRRLAASHSIRSSSSDSENQNSRVKSPKTGFERHFPRNQFPRAFGLASSHPTSRRNQALQRKGLRGVIFMLVFFVSFFLFDWWLLSGLLDKQTIQKTGLSFPMWLQGEWYRFPKDKRPPRIMYDRLLGLASHALAEGEMKPEPKELWEEPYVDASAWKPCADRRGVDHQLTHGPNGGAGFILVSANGGLNQQRVAVCNAVAVACLLNATLVLPRFLSSSVWKDGSQFADIYQQQYFIDYLKDDVIIVKELPIELQSLNLEAIGSLVTDLDVMKEAKPGFYVAKILPILMRNRVVHFHGFGNRLSFDPVPHHLQKLRCRCNFHALKFSPNIQRMGALLVQRMRNNKWASVKEERQSHIDITTGKGGHSMVNISFLQTLVGTENIRSTSKSIAEQGSYAKEKATKYLGLHLRFEIDMAAYSMCEFGGGEAERQELSAYREIHFPTLTAYIKGGKLPSAAKLREEGKCPLTPEEAVLMLAALGFKRETQIYIAGAHIYGGQSRMVALTSLFPNLVTKEDLLSPAELAPFVNNSSQLAALDFIGCAAADVFAMTDSGSQLSSLVSGYRIYYGGGLLPTIRPNKRRLAGIFSKNLTIDWTEFRDQVRKTVKQNKKANVRPIARSIYRHPRCPECMCKGQIS